MGKIANRPEQCIKNRIKRLVPVDSDDVEHPPDAELPTFGGMGFYNPI